MTNTDRMNETTPSDEVGTVSGPTAIDRYDYSLDPLDFCVVWDRQIRCPVVIDDTILAFRTADEAIAAIRRLAAAASIHAEANEPSLNDQPEK